jgi:hypothetical protein
MNVTLGHGSRNFQQLQELTNRHIAKSMHGYEKAARYEPCFIMRS